MSDKPYRVPYRQNNPTIILGVESPKLMGALILGGGMSILGFNLIGLGMAVAYWIYYNKTQNNGALKGGALHTLWRNGLWTDGKKYKFNPNDPDLYS